MPKLESDSALASELIRSSGKGSIDLQNFCNVFPHLCRQIRQDAGKGYLDCWGRSRNFDENAKCRIVHPKLITAMGRLAGRRIRKTSSAKSGHHAGLMHSYGYLLSWQETPFGLKAERYTKRNLESALRLPKSSLSSNPKRGTLLGNLTYCMGQIVYNEGEEREMLFEYAQSEIPQLIQVPFDSYEVVHIKETAQWGFAPVRDVEFHTHLVRASSVSQTVLFYSMVDEGSTQLITAFPLNNEGRVRLLSKEDADASIRPHYNAYVKGFPIQPIEGTRTVKAR